MLQVHETEIQELKRENQERIEILEAKLLGLTAGGN
jgi:hypothetical protein